MLSSSITKARDRVNALHRTLEILRADSERLAERREAFLNDGEQVLARLVELESAIDSDCRRLTSDFESLMSRLEADAVRLREEWIGFQRSLGASSSTYAAACAIPQSIPPVLRAQALGQLLRRMEGGPGFSSLRIPKP